MSGIVCAIRGGPCSRLTIKKAIDLAEEIHLPLYFLYVVNLDFLSYTSSSRTQAISEEMHHMGEFILLTAQAQAAKQGIDAQNEIREGKVAEEIVNFSKDIQANMIVLGVPGDSDDKKNIFNDQQLKEFGKYIEKETGARVILVGEEIDA